MGETPHICMGYIFLYTINIMHYVLGRVFYNELIDLIFFTCFIQL